MATYTFQYATASPRTQTHFHVGGALTITSNQRGVVLQYVPNGGTQIVPLQNENGANPLNKGNFEIAAGTIRMSVGDHAFGGDQNDIIVDIN